MAEDAVGPGRVVRADRPRGGQVNGVLRAGGGGGAAAVRGQGAGGGARAGAQVSQVRSVLQEIRLY